MKTINDKNLFWEVRFNYYFFIILIIGLMASNISQANDDKTYPGSMCIKHDAPSVDIRVSNVGSIYNNSNTATHGVICPIVHDNVNGIQRLNTVKVTVIDSNNDSAARAVECRLLSHHRENGQWFGDWTDAVRSGNGDPRVLEFGPLNTGNVADNRHYYVRCNIPPRDSNTNLASHIVSYSVVEAE